eukprot:6574263-Prymnesium_polylepis.1
METVAAAAEVAKVEAAVESAARVRLEGGVAKYALSTPTEKNTLSSSLVVFESQVCVPPTGATIRWLMLGSEHTTLVYQPKKPPDWSGTVFPDAVPLPSQPRLPVTLMLPMEALADEKTARKSGAEPVVTLHVAYCTSPTPEEASAPPLHVSVYCSAADHEWLPVEADDTLIMLP